MDHLGRDVPQITELVVQGSGARDPKQEGKSKAPPCRN